VSELDVMALRRTSRCDTATANYEVKTVNHTSTTKVKGGLAVACVILDRVALYSNNHQLHVKEIKRKNNCRWKLNFYRSDSIRFSHEFVPLEAHLANYIAYTGNVHTSLGLKKASDRTLERKEASSPYC
jgi:hypothetical protein